jgi:translation initiation factor 5A
MLQVKREEFTLLDIAEDGFVSLMSDSGEERSDMKLPDFPEDLTPEIKNKFAEGKSLVVTVQSACGIDQIVAVKEDS